MGCFEDNQAVEQVIGGFLRLFPRFDPLFAELTGRTPLVLKLELSAPPLRAEIDLSASPLVVRLGSDAAGTVGLAGPADNFHLLLLGRLPPAVAINQKKLLVRGSSAQIIKAAPLLYVAPYIYPFYLASIGRPELIVPGDSPPYHAEQKSEGLMNRIINRTAYLAGYLIGWIKTRLAPDLDVLAALEAMGQGLRRAAPLRPPPPEIPPRKSGTVG